MELKSILTDDLDNAINIFPEKSNADGNLPTLTRSELAELLSNQISLNKSEAIDMVDAFFDEIRCALERGDEVNLSGFSNFHLQDKP